MEERLSGIGYMKADSENYGAHAVDRLIDLGELTLMT